MIDKKTILSLHYFDYKGPFTGSYKKMCYRIIKEVQEDNEGKKIEKLAVTIWPGPYAYDHTDKSLHKTERFDFSKEGKDAAVDWMNEQYKTDF